MTLEPEVTSSYGGDVPDGFKAAVERELRPLEEGLTQLTRQMDRLSDQMDQLDKKVKKLDEKVDGFDEKVDGLDEKVNRLDDKVNRLTTVVGLGRRPGALLWNVIHAPFDLEVVPFPNGDDPTSPPYHLPPLTSVQAVKALSEDDHRAYARGYFPDSQSQGAPDQEAEIRRAIGADRCRQ